MLLLTNNTKSHPNIIHSLKMVVVKYSLQASALFVNFDNLFEAIYKTTLHDRILKDVMFQFLLL